MNFIAKGAKIDNIRYVMYQQKKNWQHYYTSDKVYKYIPCYISSSVPLYVFCLHPSWHVPNERTKEEIVFSLLDSRQTATLTTSEVC